MTRSARRHGAHRIACLALLVVACGPRRGAASLLDVVGGRALLGDLGNDAARAAAHATPLSSVSGSTGFAFQYDPTTSLFKRDLVVAGELFVERADPLEVGRFNLSTLWEHLNFTSIDGKDFDDISSHGATLPARGRFKGEKIIGLKLRDYDLDLTVDQELMSATYGLTEHSDLSLTLSLVHSDADRTAHVRIVTTDRTSKAMSSPDSGSSTGPGDTILRWKQRLLLLPYLHGAIGLVLRAPTGDRNDFQGTGSFEASPMIYLSTRPLNLGGGMQGSAHLNLGVELDARSVDRSQARYALAVDVMTRWDLTVGAAVLGHSEFSTPTISFTPGVVPSRTRRDEIDGSVGMRLAVLGPDTASTLVWRPERVLIFANVLVPLNHDGVRAEAIPIVGAEALF